MTVTLPPQCIECVHLQDVTIPSCEAFPEKIPMEIWFGDFDHTKPFEDDNGILFEAKTEKEKSLEDLSHEEFVDSLFDKSYTFTNILWLLKAIMVAPLMGRFQKLAPQEAEDLYQDMIKEMIKPERWSITDISKVLRKKFPELTDFEAERIARTETTMIANKARELKYVEEAPEAKYVWIGPDDHRTTKICREIKATQPTEGLTLNDLKAHVRKVANANGETMLRDWIPHIDCRHTFKRVM